jgi:hypothetical protein
MESKTRDAAWGLGSALAIIIGCVGPWATFGPFSASGTRGDGIWLVFVGVLALGCIWLGRAPLLTGLGGLIAAFVGFANTIHVGTYSDEVISASPGWGVILTAAAGLSLAAWAWHPFVRRSRDRVASRVDRS